MVFSSKIGAERVLAIAVLVQAFSSGSGGQVTNTPESTVRSRAIVEELWTWIRGSARRTNESLVEVAIVDLIDLHNHIHGMVPYLLDAMNDDRANIPCLAADALAALGDVRACPRLFLAAIYDRPRYGRSARSALRRLTNDYRLFNITKGDLFRAETGVDSPNGMQQTRYPELPWFTCMSGWPKRTDPPDRELTWLLETTRHADPDLAACAFWCLTTRAHGFGRPEVVDVCTAGLTHSNHFVRTAAVHSLAANASSAQRSQAAKLITARLRDCDQKVRRCAAMALRHLGEESAVESGGPDPGE